MLISQIFEIIMFPLFVFSKRDCVVLWELEVLQAVNHHNIVRIYGYVTHPWSNRISFPSS